MVQLGKEVSPRRSFVASYLEVENNSSAVRGGTFPFDQELGLPPSGTWIAMVYANGKRR